MTQPDVNGDEAPNPTPNLIAVASGKGGVGKTWFSVTLANAMARRGKRALLFDGDLGMANIDIQLGIRPDRDLSDVLTRGGYLEDVISGYAPGNFDIISGRSGSGSLALLSPQALQHLSRQLDELSARYDYIIVDLGAGLEQSVRHLALQCGTTLVVTTDEPTALTDAYAFIKVMSQFSTVTDVRVVVNMASTIREGERTYRTLEKACRSFLKRHFPLAGVIRRDRAVREAVRTQLPIFSRWPDSEAAVDVDLLAEAFLRGSENA